MPSTLLDPGLISLNNNGAMMTTHFSLDLFDSGGVLAIGSGTVTLSDGFAGSLATALAGDPSLRIDLSGSTKMEIVGSVADLTALAMELDGLGLSLTDFFGSDSVGVIFQDTEANLQALLDDPSEYALFTNVLQVDLPPGSSLTIQLDDFFDNPEVLLNGVDTVILRGTAAEVSSFAAAPQDPDFLALLAGFEITEGTLFTTADLINTNLLQPLFLNPISPTAIVEVTGTVAEFLDPGFDANFLIQASGGGDAFMHVVDDASNIRDNYFDLGGVIDGYDTTYRHLVSADDIGSPLVSFDNVIDYYEFDASVFTEGGSVSLSTFDVALDGGFTPGPDDVLDISAATGITTTFDTSPGIDIAFVDTLGIRSSTVDGLPAVDIHLEPGSTFVQFDGLIGAYGDGIDFTINIDDDRVGTLSGTVITNGLTVENFFGIPHIDQILHEDMESSGNIPDIDLFRFLGLESFGTAQQTYDYLHEFFYFGLNSRESHVDGLTNTEGDILVGDEFGSGEDDYLIGGNDDDVIFGVDGNDTLEGGRGDDFIDGGWGMDEIMGGKGDDFLTGKYDDDVIYGGDGEDDIDDIWGVNTVYAEDGDDTVYASGEIHGGDGNDILNGSNGDDTIFGDAGDDSLYGSWGNDALNGGTGQDTLTGGPGSDTLVGGADTDVLSGGTGRDIFTYFRQASFGDLITDFATTTSSGPGDLFWLNGGTDLSTTGAFDLGAAHQPTASLFTTTTYTFISTGPTSTTTMGTSTYVTHVISTPVTTLAHAHVINGSSEGYLNFGLVPVYGSSILTDTSLTAPLMPFIFTQNSTGASGTTTLDLFRNYLVGRDVSAATQVINVITDTTLGTPVSHLQTTTVSHTRTYLAFGLVNGKVLLATVVNAPVDTGEGWSSEIVSSEVQVRSIASLTNYTSLATWTPNILLSNVFGLPVETVII